MGNLLPITVVLPMAGALLLWLSPAKSKIAVRQSALITTVLTLALTAILLKDYTLAGGPYSEWIFRWLGEDSAVDVQCSLALDGLSVWLFGLTSLLMVTAVLVSWESIEDRPSSYYGLLLLLQTGMLGVFAARDIILFYVFFEFTLIPLFFLIGVWGSEDRRYAAIKFFIFTLAGSLLTFVGLLAIVLWNYYHVSGDQIVMTFSISELTAGLDRNPLPASYQLWIFLALFAGFAIKVPLFPLHTWLPLAHVQAPAAGSVILAGVLLKIGSYGFLRFSIPMLPEATAACAHWLLWLSVAGIIYGALVALVQTDMKRLIAYSSVSHLGFCMLGLFSLTRLGTQGSVLQMVNHGLSTGGLFAIVGMLYERYHTREIAQFGGLSRRTPWLALAFVFFTFSSIGLPGLNGFAGEFLILLGMFQRAWMGTSTLLRIEFTAIATLAVLGVVLGAWYMLFLVQRVFFGPLKEPSGHGTGGHEAGHDEHAAATDHDSGGHDSHGHGAATALPPGVSDMSFREGMALAPLVVFMLWIGLWPQFFLDRMSGTVEELTKVATQQFDENYGPAVVPTAVADISAAQPSAKQLVSGDDKITEVIAGPLKVGRRSAAPLPAEELQRAN